MKNNVIRFLYAQTVVVSMIAGLCGCGSKAPEVNEPQDTEASDVEVAEADPLLAEEEDSTDASTQELVKRDIDLNNVTAYEYEEEGITLYLPPEYLDTKGYIDYTATDLTSGDGVYILEASYCGMSTADLDYLMTNENRTDEDIARYRNSMMLLFGIIGIDKNRDASDIVEIVNARVRENGGSEDNFMEESDLIEVATYDDCTYYKEKMSEENNYDNLEPEFKEEYDLLFSYTDSIIENANYHKAQGMFPGVIGKKISFETTDIDGNTITSEELFGEHDITMVNVWATWCGWCIKELPELEEINNRLADKNCAIVGLLGDGTDDSLIAEGKTMLADAGCTYTCILPYDGWQDDFTIDEGWPTSFLVDSTGTIVAAPIIGAQVDEYEKAIDRALAGKTEKSGNDQGYNVVENSEGVYRIFVVDGDSNPVEGATIQFCSGDTCYMAETDEDGVAVFDKPEDTYEVHVLQVPDGYKADDELYLTAGTYSDLTIVLENE